MSNARFNPGTGEWGPFGTAPGSQVRKLREYLDKGGEGGKGVMPKVMPGGGIEEISGQNIPNLGPEKYYQRRTGNWLQNWASQGIGPTTSNLTPKGFKRHWYEPMRRFSTSDVYKGWKGIDTDEGLWTYATPQQEEKAILPKDADIAFELEKAETAKATAFDAYTESIKGLDIREEEERTGFRTGQKEAGRARQLAAEGAEEEYQAADVQVGATGMAYSAPAEEGYQMEGARQSMADIAAGESTLRTGHLKGLRDIEKERTGVEGDWVGAQQTYYEDIDLAYEKAELALDDILSDLEMVYTQHTDTGGFEPGLAGIGGMFKESKPSIPHYSESRQRAQDAQDYADIQRTTAQEAYSNV